MDVESSNTENIGLRKAVLDSATPGPIQLFLRPIFSVLDSSPSTICIIALRSENNILDLMYFINKSKQRKTDLELLKLLLSCPSAHMSLEFDESIDHGYILLPGNVPFDCCLNDNCLCFHSESQILLSTEFSSCKSLHDTKDCFKNQQY